MISIIVPIYNLDEYLPKCIDSIISQTYRDIEIILIDDGSTDRCGTICDDYAERDPRIRVFHTENKGISAARNLGISESKGEYIGFVDSDDWIEPDMYEVLFKKAAETGADIVECGVFEEDQGNTSIKSWTENELSGMNAVHELIQGHFGECVWDKLFKRKCFDDINFPEGREHEDSAVMYKLLYYADSICSIPEAKYHYLHRKGSVSRNFKINNLICFWLSFKERFFFLHELVDEGDRQILLMKCALAISRTWAHYYDCSREDRSVHKTTIAEMHTFSKEYIPLFGIKKWPARIKIGSFFPHFKNALSFRMAWLINRVA